LADRARAAVVEALFGALQTAVSTVTRDVLVGRGYLPSPALHTLAFGTGTARIGRRGELLLRVRYGYRLVPHPGDSGRWTVVTAGYVYRVLASAEQPILSYHWHPEGLSSVTYPHLHIELGTSPIDLSKAHLPSGPISLVTVVRMTISELGVEPLRTNWREVLDRAEATISA
jgi:hypothetical protein